MRCRSLFSTLIVVLTIVQPIYAQTPVQSEQQGEQTMQIQIESVAQNIRITATLADNATARDFYALLPLKLNMRDYASSEKIADLPRSLSTQDAPSGYAAKRGDLTYYAPWGNLAVFYKNYSGTASGLIYLGKINSGMEHLEKLNQTQVSITATND